MNSVFCAVIYKNYLILNLFWWDSSTLPFISICSYSSFISVSNSITVILHWVMYSIHLLWCLVRFYLDKVQHLGIYLIDFLKISILVFGTSNFTKNIEKYCQIRHIQNKIWCTILLYIENVAKFRLLV